MWTERLFVVFVDSLRFLDHDHLNWIRILYGVKIAYFSFAITRSLRKISKFIFRLISWFIVHSHQIRTNKFIWFIVLCRFDMFLVFMFKMNIKSRLSKEQTLFKNWMYMLNLFINVTFFMNLQKLLSQWPIKNYWTKTEMNGFTILWKSN